MEDTLDKCLAFCQTLVMSNQKFTFNLILGKDKFFFSNKELVSSWQKKKSPSQMRREERRKTNHLQEKVTGKVTEKVSEEASVRRTGPSSVVPCDQCDFKSTSERGLRQHIRIKHKVSQQDGASVEVVNSNVETDHIKVVDVVRALEFKCKLCEFDASSRIHLKKHIEEEHDHYECTTCGEICYADMLGEQIHECITKHRRERRPGSQTERK